MVIYIPKNVDVYNTHLKNLVEAYANNGVKTMVGYETYIYGSFIPDVIHFHMVEGLLNYMNFDEKQFFLRLDFYKKHGVIFLYTAHDLIPHQKTSRIDYNSFFKIFFSYIDIFIHHGNASINILKNEFNNLNSKKHIVCHHGDYLADIKDYSEKQDAAKDYYNLPQNKKVILLFGQLQFKNTKFAISVFKKIYKRRHDCILLIAGINPLFKYAGLNKIYYYVNNKYFNFFRLKKRVIHKRFSNYEMFLLFKAADVVFLPHNFGLTSGIIPMAATIGKPFVYPNIGVFEEQAKHCLSIKYTKDDMFEAYNAINNILSAALASFDNSKWLAHNSWNDHVKTILNELSNYNTN